MAVSSLSTVDDHTDFGIEHFYYNSQANLNATKGSSDLLDERDDSPGTAWSGRQGLECVYLLPLALIKLVAHPYLPP